MKVFAVGFFLIAGVVAIGMLTTTQVVAQGDDAFCGETGAMIVSADAIAGDIRTIAYAYAAGDSEAPALLEAHELSINTEVVDSEFETVVNVGMATGVLSSASQAHRLLPGLDDCSRFNFLSLD